MEIVKAWLPLLFILSLWVCIGTYLSRKTARHRKTVQADPARPEDSLTLVRGTEQTNYLRNYAVIIDGNTVGVIAAGETKHFAPGPGPHTLQLRIDWCKTRPLPFEIVPGKNTCLLCGATYTDWRCIYKHMTDAAGYLYARPPAEVPPARDCG